MPRKEIVRQALAALEEEGRLTPASLVEAARSPEHPLHKSFEWDDSLAAERWRLEQARTIIRSVEIIVATKHSEIRVPVYVKDPRLAEDVQGYSAIRKLSKAEQQAALDLELARVEANLERAERIAQSLGFAPQLEALSRRVRSFRREIKAAPPRRPLGRPEARA